MKPAPVRGVLFDLDGTLLNTLDDLAHAGNTALGKLGYAPHPVDAYRYFVGSGVAELARRIMPEELRQDADIHARVLKAFREVYDQCWKDLTRPYPGVEDMLAGLVERGVPVAVVSNKPQELTTIAVDAFLSHVPFRMVIGATDDVPRKPAPDMALAVATEWKVAPADLLYVGDTSVDMQTATAAGMYAVGVTWGFRDEPELLENGARVLIREPRELLGLL